LFGNVKYCYDVCASSFYNLKNRIMKKVQTKQSKKLTLGKMTVAKLMASQMKFLAGGDNPTLQQDPPPSEPGQYGPNCTARTHFI
jgi:natural product precursor